MARLPSRIPIRSAIALTAAFLMALLLGLSADRGVAAECPGGDQPVSQTGAGAAEKATLCLMNKERVSRGLRPLHVDKRQARAAGEHNRLMVRKGCFSHLCPGERDLVARIATTGYLPCSCTWQVAENIAWGAGRSGSPKQIVEAWMNSAGHRANILNPRFDEVGVAVHEGSPEGAHDSAATFTTDFGFKS